MFGLSIGPAAWVVGVLGLGGLVWWGVDEIGDRREAKVNARWELRLADARTADRMKSLVRERKAAGLREAENASMAHALLEADLARQDAEDRLADRGKVVAYPKDIIKALNR